MRNLFEINEDEKNRILGLHEQATKNHYLINEQGVVVDNYKVAKTLGFGVDRTMSNNCQRVMILDGNGYYNLVSNVCPGGYIDFKIEADYENTTITGSWVVSNQNVTITMSDGTKFTGSLTDGSVKTQVTNWLVKQPKFGEYAKKQMDPSIKDTWKSWGGGDAQTKTENSVGSKQGITWDIAVKRWPCFANLKDKNIYNDGKYDYVIYQIGGLDYYVYIGDGHVYNPSTKNFTSTYLGKDYPCDPPVVQPKPDPGVTGGGSGSSGGQESPNQKRIKELQRKVGVKDDGILGKMTLKAIMDKLSQ